MIHYVTGDLFEIPNLDALAHGVNCAGKMGRGVAKEFRERYPEMFREYQRRCVRSPLREPLRPGDMFVWVGLGGLIYNLATQDLPGPRASLLAIERSVRRMLGHGWRGVQQIGMPRIGCGLGGLDWKDVRPVIERAALDSPIELIIVSLPGDA